MNNACFIAQKCSSFPFRASHASTFSLILHIRRNFVAGQTGSVRSLSSLPNITSSGFGSASSSQCALPNPFRLARPFHSTSLCLKKRTSKPMPRKPPPLKTPDRVVIPFGAISKDSLHSIFGEEVPYVDGNEVLRMLQERRSSGALVDKGVQPDFPTSIPSQSLLKALEWLRQKYPVDEKQAAERWASMEAARLEDEYIARAEKLGLYKASSESSFDYRDSSTSVLQEYQQFNEQKRIREEKEREKSGEAQKSRELALAKQEERNKKQVELEEETARRRKKRQHAGRASNDTEVPTMTTFQRLWRPSLFAFLFLSVTGVLADHYTPVQQADRLFPNIPVAWATIGAVIGLNCFVYALWYIPLCWRLLNTYTMSVPANPVAVSVLFNTFSHRTFKHLCTNMLVGVLLYGIPVHEELGRANFLFIYFSGGVVGSVASLWYYTLLRQFAVYTCGASGSVFTLLTTWAIFNINKPMPSSQRDGFVLDVTRWSVLLVTCLGHLAPRWIIDTDWMSHLGGVLAGLAYGTLFYLNTPTPTSTIPVQSKTRIGDKGQQDVDDEKKP